MWQWTAEAHTFREAGRKRVCAAVYRWYSRKGWQVKQAADIYEWEDLTESAPDGTRFVGEISAEARSLIRQAGRSLRADRSIRRRC